LLAACLTGAGEGWVTPFFVSPALFLLLPATLAVGRPESSRGRLLLVAVVIAAVVADCLMVTWSFGERYEFRWYAQVNGLIGWIIIGLWICLWFFWQVLALRALLTSRRTANV
jgi:hypothetical protein